MTFRINLCSLSCILCDMPTFFSPSMSLFHSGYNLLYWLTSSDSHVKTFFQRFLHRFPYQSPSSLPVKRLKSQTCLHQQKNHMPTFYYTVLFFPFKVMCHKPVIVKWDYAVISHTQFGSQCVGYEKAVGGWNANCTAVELMETLNLRSAGTHTRHCSVQSTISG